MWRSSPPLTHTAHNLVNRRTYLADSFQGIPDQAAYGAKRFREGLEAQSPYPAASRFSWWPFGKKKTTPTSSPNRRHTLTVSPAQPHPVLPHPKPRPMPPHSILIPLHSCPSLPHPTPIQSSPPLHPIPLHAHPSPCRRSHKMLSAAETESAEQTGVWVDKIASQMTILNKNNVSRVQRDARWATTPYCF